MAPNTAAVAAGRHTSIRWPVSIGVIRRRLRILAEPVHGITRAEDNAQTENVSRHDRFLLTGRLL